MDPTMQLERPRRIPLQDRAKHKHQALLDAALAEFTDHEYPEVTTKSIAERAGVAAGTFYQYFESKDHILREVARLRLAAFTELIVDEDGTPLPRVLSEQPIGAHIRASMEITYRFHYENPRLHGTIEQRRALDPELDAMAAAGDQMILERVAAALRRWGIDQSDERAFVIVSMAEGLIHRHVFGSQTVSKAVVMEMAAEMITKYLETHQS